jgi:predicted Holliday junction resolvase-like endonuclease
MDASILLVVIVVAIIILWLWSRTSSLRAEVTKARAEVGRLSGHIEQEAMAQFQRWRDTEYNALKKQEGEVAERAAQVKLAEWQASSEAGIRADAIQRSQSVIVGKVSEHILPHLPEFTYNPKDARFIGSPVDFVVFDGLDAGNVEQVVLIEVKTGTGALTRRERQVRDAVVAKRVTWQEMRIDARKPTAAHHTTTKEADLQSVVVATWTCPECGIQNEIHAVDPGQRTIRCGYCETEFPEAGS